ncbi:MAG: Calx-beta domain-containing protein, partial [Cyanobacteriota bacterium]
VTMAKLQQALQAVAADLAGFAAKGDVLSPLASVVGGDGSQATAHALQAQLLRQELGPLARVRVVSASQLAGANAAYARASDTILLSDRFLAEAPLSELRAVLLEEIGHAMDARINPSDRPGDEGELFSLLVRGLTPSASERQRILAEDDRRTLILDGVPVAVEQAAPVVYETTTVFSPTRGKEGIRYKISGLQATWLTRKGANSILNFYDGTSAKIIANSIYSTYGYFGTSILSDGSVSYFRPEGSTLALFRYSAGVTTKIASTKDPYNLMIDGDITAWQDWDGASNSYDIYRHQGNTVTRVTTNAVGEEDVQLSGSRLAWASHDGNDYEIYLNDGTTTRALTNNNLDDYSPVLSGNRAAWLQWNNNQENLFFFDGTNTRQVTTNKDVYHPLIAGNTLIFQQLESSGKFSLQSYNSSTKKVTQLSADLGPLQYNAISPRAIEVSGNLVAWLENKPGDSYPGPNTAILKLFNGSKTITVDDNALADLSSSTYGGSPDNLTSPILTLRGSKLVYLALPTGGGASDSDLGLPRLGQLYLYDASSPSPAKVQLTQDEDFSSLPDLDVSGNRILWGDRGELKLTQPTTKPILTLAGPNAPVVEGQTSPQHATLTVTLSTASTSTVTVNYETINKPFDGDTAQDGSDYTLTSGVLTFAAGVTSQTIKVPIVNDDWAEEDETFRVRLFDPTNAVLVPGLTTASVTLTDTWKVSGANGASFTLPAGVENLTLTGTTNINAIGNGAANVIRGNSGNNRLDGGGGQYDNLIGGPGDDTYVINRTFDTSWQYITENPGEGTDTIEYSTASTTTQNISVDDNVEHFILKGSGHHSIYGNNLNNVITGNSGDNILDGGVGLDTVNYGTAPNAVTVNLLTGVANGWGMDTLSTFEAIVGSRFNDTLTGDGANNTLSGGFGADRLTGSGGADRFDYRILTHSRLGSSFLDGITDFNGASGGDSFLVPTARAGFLNAGPVTALTAAALTAKLTPSSFLAHYAATLQLGSGATTRWFVAINNATAGFDANADALIEVTGFSGTIGASQFITG